MRRRSDPGDDVRLLHVRLKDRLSALSPRWWPARQKIDEPKLNEGLESQVNLGPSLPDNANGYIAYVLRDPKYVGDIAEFDDRLVLDILLAHQEYGDAIDQMFTCLVSAFEPYRAAVLLDVDLALDDWEAANIKGDNSGKDEDGRDGVFRFPPVGYFDDTLCLRAFGIGHGELARRLGRVAERVTKLNGGVLFVVSKQPLHREGLEALDRRIREEIALP